MCVARACEPRLSARSSAFVHRNGGRSAIAIATSCAPPPSQEQDRLAHREVCESLPLGGALWRHMFSQSAHSATRGTNARNTTSPLSLRRLASAPHRLLDNRHAPARPPHHQSKTRHSGDCVRGACERSGRRLRRRQVRGGRAGREPRGVARHRASEGLVLAVAVVTLAAVSGDAASDLLRLVA